MYRINKFITNFRGPALPSILTHLSSMAQFFKLHHVLTKETQHDIFKVTDCNLLTYQINIDEFEISANHARRKLKIQYKVKYKRKHYYVNLEAYEYEHKNYTAMLTLYSHSNAECLELHWVQFSNTEYNTYHMYGSQGLRFKDDIPQLVSPKKILEEYLNRLSIVKETFNQLESTNMQKTKPTEFNIIEVNLYKLMLDISVYSACNHPSGNYLVQAAINAQNHNSHMCLVNSNKTVSCIKHIKNPKTKEKVKALNAHILALVEDEAKKISVMLADLHEQIAYTKANIMLT